jgi:tetraacyldisaccharide 4'-kinase
MPPARALAPLSLLYGASVRTRLALYRKGLLKTERVAAPVVSVGNITTGGTGKTPLVEWIARTAAADGHRICILSRGYGRANSRARVVVSDGERLLADATQGGDEPRLLAEQLLGKASVVSDADRVGAARWAIENLGANALVLDDGFQHLRIERDLNIVTLDATSPWGGGHLLPRGRLRESPEGLARADCVVITRADHTANLGALRDEVMRLARDRVAIISSRAKTIGLRPLSEEKNLETSRPVGAFCAVGNPDAFLAHVRRDGHQLAYSRAFVDHHRFTQLELNAIAREAASRGATALLTTTKDAVKLRSLELALPTYVVEIGLEFDHERLLISLVQSAFKKH